MERRHELRALFSRPGFVCVNVANVLDGICYFGIVPLLTTYLQTQFGLADQPVGWIFSLYVGAVTLMMFPGGWVCDRLGARRALLIALAMLGCGRTLLVFAGARPDGLPLALLALFVMSLGTGIVQPTVYAGVKEYTRAELAAPGYAWLYAIMNLGSVLWMLLSPWVRSALGGIEAVYAVLAGLTWLNLALQWLFFREAGNPVVKEAGAEQRRIFTELRFLCFIFMLMPVRNLVAHLNVTFPTYLSRVHPGLQPYLEWFFALNYALLFLGTPLLTRATSGRPVLGLMIQGSAVSALALGFLLLPPHALWVVAFMVLFSLGEAVWQARFYQYVAEEAPAGQVGAAMSLANFPWFLAKTTAGMYSGAMLQRFVPAQGPHSPDVLWGTYLGVALLTPVSLFLTRNWLEKKKAPSHGASGAYE